MSDRIDRAKVKITLHHPWLAVAMFHLRFSPNPNVPTMATDGTYVYYNEAFVEHLTDAECLGVMLHEISHCILAHPYRRQERNPVRWNIACDAVVNSILLAEGLTLPDGCVPPVEANKTAEDVYESLSAEAGLPQSLLDVQDASDVSDASDASEPNLTEADWREISARSAGLAPSNLRTALQIALEPIVDWRNELALYVSGTVRSSDHTWSRASRRHPLMPGWKRDPKVSLAVCIDTSGSVSETLLQRFWSEFSAITAVAGVSAYLITSDADVHQVIDPGSPLPTHIMGGGGTSFIPALRWCENLDVPCVYFTDGDGHYPDTCGVSVLWVLTQKRDVPFGRSIHIKGE